jgi:hypothetical protein
MYNFFEMLTESIFNNYCKWDILCIYYYYHPLLTAKGKKSLAYEKKKIYNTL